MDYVVLVLAITCALMHPLTLRVGSRVRRL
jgi:hypothetical protein